MQEAITFLTVTFTLLLACVATVILVFSVFPRLRTGKGAGEIEKSTNLAVARERLEELRTQLGAGEISEGEAKAREEEIGLHLLEDVEGGDRLPGMSKPVTDWLGASLAGLFVLIGTPVIYLAVGSPDSMLADNTPQAATSQRQNAQQAHQEGEEDLLALLEREPNDVNALMGLARLRILQNRDREAADFYGKARAVAGDMPVLVIGQLDAVLRAGDDGGEADELVRIALDIAPNAPVVNWLAGLRARNLGDFTKAREFWQTAQAALGQNGSQAERQQVANALSSLPVDEGGGPTLASTTAPGSPVVEPSQGGGDIAQQGNAVERVFVKVSLDESLASKVSDSDVLFVFARASEGPPMPLAVVRSNVGKLPMEVALDDELAMMPQLKMSGFQNYKVVARISKNGDVIAKPGDMFGEVLASPGDRVNVIIDKVVE